ncbi:methyltransferase domain-containing protein [Streptomyces sp. NPDC051662]|uniref:methyltransferase domain-containing protein n=1 Tax=Streptomyces sp. NPDC051662 TaxID=3154750 RepID=UPI003419B8E5
MDDRGLWPADSPWVRRAAQAYPRHLFAPDQLWTWDGHAYVPVERATDPEGWAELVYAGPSTAAITQVTGGLPSSSLSCEDVVADMLDSLILEPGHITLELGTATGRNARLLAAQAGPGRVTSIEYDPQLAAAAAANLAAVRPPNGLPEARDNPCGRRATHDRRSTVRTADLDVLRCYAPDHPSTAGEHLMPDIEAENQGVWTVYGAHQIARARARELPELNHWSWDIPDAGPGVEVFGEVAGLRVLDLGSGLGRHAARMAALGAQVTAVDSSPTQHERAATRYPAAHGLRLECSDAADHLRDADPYDLVYSVSGVPFTDPRRLLPALANGVRPGGRLIFSALHTNSRGVGPSSEVAARPEVLRLPGTTEDHTVHMWVLTEALWENLLSEHGFILESVTAIDTPQRDNAVSYRLYEARRPERVPSRPRTPALPPPNAALGVGVIVRGAEGVLLGRHRSGTWELVGGSVEPSEVFAEAAVRELYEEAGLLADPGDVRVLGTLLDRVGDVVRLTVPVLVTAWSGTPRQREEVIGAWRFWPLHALPQPLFVPSAQCLTAWSPSLPLDHPPVHIERLGHLPEPGARLERLPRQGGRLPYAPGSAPS